MILRDTLFGYLVIICICRGNYGLTSYTMSINNKHTYTNKQTYAISQEHDYEFYGTRVFVSEHL